MARLTRRAINSAAVQGRRILRSGCVGMPHTTSIIGVHGWFAMIAAMRSPRSPMERPLVAGMSVPACSASTGRTYRSGATHADVLPWAAQSPPQFAGGQMMTKAFPTTSSSGMVPK